MFAAIPLIFINDTIGASIMEAWYDSPISGIKEFIRDYAKRGELDFQQCLVAGVEMSFYQLTDDQKEYLITTLYQ